MSDFPGWSIDGKTFKSVAGLCKYLTRKHGGDSTSMVRSDRSLSVYAGRTEVARYIVAAPKLGQSMLLTLQA